MPVPEMTNAALPPVVTEESRREFIASFIADEGADDTEADDAPANDTEAEAAADEDTEAEDSDDTEDEPEAEASAEADDTEAEAAEPPTASKIDVKSLERAIKNGNTDLFLKALGDEAAEKLLGGKAHKALLGTMKDIRDSRRKLTQANKDLETKFGDPAAARAAAASGNADAFVEAVEKFFGASWADCIRFVNASFAGKPARLEAKQREAAQKQQAQQAEQTAAMGRIKTSIEGTVKKTDPQLLERYPGLVDRVYQKMKQGYRSGIDSPAKALAAVKRDLKAEHERLTQVFTESRRKPTTQLRPPQPTGKPGREQTADEFRRQFIQDHARAERAKKAKAKRVAP